MASQRIVATSTPTVVSGLTEGKRYVFQNQSPDTVVYATTEATVPARTSPAFVMGVLGSPAGSGTVRLDPGEQLYLWTARGRAALVYDEEA